MRLLHYLEIQNFKRFGERQRMELDHAGVLIGPNNCGKTTAIQAIALWSLAPWPGAVGTDAAGEQLGPPASLDVLVEQAERNLEMAGRRWLWRDGGWEPLAASIHVTQRFDDDSGERRRIGPVPATVEPDAPFTLIDAWPSFEWTPTDNVWRGTGSD